MDGAERAKRRIGRPSMVEDFRIRVVEILQEQPALASLEILRRVRETGYQGGRTRYTRFRSKQAQPKSISPEAMAFL